MKIVGKFIKRYIDEMVETMSKMYPDLDELEIRETVEKLVEKNGQNPVCELDNNYTGENRESTLLAVLDWIADRNPIIAGNATFYMNQYEAINPIATMLLGFLTDRKMYKKKMFAVGDATSHLYKYYDLSQQNEKKNANS